MNMMQPIIWYRVTDSSWQINFIYEYSYDNQGNPADLRLTDNITDSTSTRTNGHLMMIR